MGRKNETIEVNVKKMLTSLGLIKVVLDPIFSRDFGISSVKGRNLSHAPAASIIAFINYFVPGMSSSISFNDIQLSVDSSDLPCFKIDFATANMAGYALLNIWFA